MGNTYSRKRYLENKQSKIKQVLLRKEKIRSWYHLQKSTQHCRFCGESMTYCLDYHHLNPTEKRDAVHQMVTNGCAISTIQKEMNKCWVVCSTCHRKLHFEKEILTSFKPKDLNTLDHIIR